MAFANNCLFFCIIALQYFLYCVYLLWELYIHFLYMVCVIFIWIFQEFFPLCLLSCTDELMLLFPKGSGGKPSVRPEHIRTFVLLLDALMMFRCIPLLTQSLCGQFGGPCPVRDTFSHIDAHANTHTCVNHNIYKRLLRRRSSNLHRNAYIFKDN